MEFRYRAIDIDRPPPATDMAPLNPNLSFFSARPIPAREATQREIEKEQIRQEIIAAEAARRRELIAEVAHEMAIEREMAIRSVAEKEGMSLTMSITQRKLPNQNQDNNLFRLKRTYSDPMMYTSSNSLVTPLRMKLPPLQQMPEAKEAKATPVLESNEEKLIILDRADPIVEKTDSQTGLERAKRKADGVEGGLNEPFERKRLHSEPRDLELKPASLRNNSSEIPCLGNLGSGTQVRAVESKTKSMYKFWCDVCSVGAFSETVMKSHELGKKHKAALNRQNQLSDTAASTSITMVPASVTAPQSEAISVLANKQCQKVEGEMAAKEAGKMTEGEKKKSVAIRCETCNILTYSEQVMKTHKLGRKHKAMLKKQYSEQVLETHMLEKKPLDDLDTNIITVPLESLNADGSEDELEKAS